MTARDDELTSQLDQELHDRVDTMTDSPLTLGAVRGKAHSIRRRRTAISVVAAAAAVAVIVPTAALASHHVDGKSHSLPPATQNVTPTPSPLTSPTTSPTTSAPTPPDGHQPAPGVLDVSDLPTGDLPRMSYVTGGHVLHQVDGSTLDIGTRHPVVGFVSMSDGSTVWQTSDGQNPTVEVQDASGILQAPVASAWGLATNAAHTAAAWVGRDGQVMVWRVGSFEPTPLGDPITAGSDLRIGTVSDDCTPAGCTVDVNLADAQGPSWWQPWEVTESGSQRLLDGSFLSVVDQSAGGLTIGFSKVSDFGTCSKLMGGGEFQGWSTCRHTLVSFSPDDRLVLADPAYHDGIGNGVIAMYDAGNGDLLFNRRSSAKALSFYPEAQWEDKAHALAPVFQDGRWAIVRFASDGSMEYAVPPVPGEENNPYVLATDGMSYGD